MPDFITGTMPSDYTVQLQLGIRKERGLHPRLHASVLFSLILRPASGQTTWQYIDVTVAAGKRIHWW